MSVLLLVEHEGGKVRDATLPAVTAAAKLGEVHALVAGANVAGVAAAAAKIAGVAKVLTADAAHLEHQSAEAVAPVAARLMANYDALVAPATTFGKNIAPRVAALIDVMQISDVIGVEDANTFVRPIYAGNAIATVRSSDARKVLTVRGTAFENAARDSSMRCSIRSPTSSAPRSARAAPRSTPAMHPTITRSARPARSSLPTSISRSVFRVRSSTLPE